MYVCRSYQSAYSYHSSLTAATHSRATYVLQLAQATEGDMKCNPVLVHKQQGIINTTEMLHLLNAGGVLVVEVVVIHNEGIILCCGSTIINLVPPQELPHSYFHVFFLDLFA